MILTPILKFDFEEVKELSPTIRGSGGFGSTAGKNFETRFIEKIF